MPIVEPSYRPPWGLRNGHAQSVLARFLRRIPPSAYTRRRLELPDGDFLDLDEIIQGHGRIAILLHGLEASSQAPYVRAMAATLLDQRWDIVAMNFRGCSGEPNRLMRSYHSGVSDDLEHVIADMGKRYASPALALVGFSLGGNVTLRYLGEKGIAARDQGVTVAAAISVPSDLEACAERFKAPANRFYMNRFLRCLFQKVRHRQELFPSALDYDSVLASRHFHDFDGRFTAPVHGFDSAQDYWTRCSGKAVARAIAVPTLLVNARDDPFLTESCHLLEEAREHPYLHADIPSHGGHVGFITLRGKNGFYQESRVQAFFRSQTGSPHHQD